MNLKTCYSAVVVLLLIECATGEKNASSLEFVCSRVPRRASGFEISQTQSYYQKLPKEIGCAEIRFPFQSATNEKLSPPKLILQCQRGFITSIDLAIVGRVRGRCGSFSIDTALCLPIFFHQYTSDRCVNQHRCALKGSDILLHTNTAQPCPGFLPVAAVQFRCSEIGLKQKAWFDEVKNSEERDAFAEANRGYELRPPTFQLVGGSFVNSTSCGFAFDVDFITLECPEGFIVASIASAQYGVYNTNEGCIDGVDWEYKDSWPKMACSGHSIAPYLEDRCKNRTICHAYVPPRNVGNDLSCPNRKRSVVAIARCAPTTSKNI